MSVEATASRTRAIARSDAPPPHPLTFAQERIWFLEQLYPGGAHYNTNSAVRLRGKVDRDALIETVDTIISRHATLRTRFTTVDGVPRQIAAEHRDVQPEFIDLEDAPENERESVAMEYLRAHASGACDIVNGPVARPLLVRLSDDDFFLLQTIHHLVSDGWSLRILREELASIYTSIVEGSEPALPELTLAYTDYAHWEREQLQGKTLESHMTFWREYLAGAPDPINLPFDRPRPRHTDYEGGWHHFDLPGDLVEGVRTLSAQFKTTQFILMLAAFQILLQRYTRCDDIVVGTPIANRTRLELEPLIGLFANTAALRCDLSGNPTFSELVRQAAAAAIEAYSHQELPFSKLVEEINPTRDMSRMPLCQVVFTLEQSPWKTAELPGATMQRLPLLTENVLFDLHFRFFASADSMRGVFGYATSMYDHESIMRMADQYTHLLGEIVASPDLPISSYSLLSGPVREQIVNDWNPAYPSAKGPQTLPGWFDRSAAAAPDAVAVTDDERSVTYRELLERADALAALLAARGASPGTRIAICTERNAGLIVGILGIMKTGAAYVPLDPAHPEERLAFMIQDSRCEFVVTQSTMLDRLPESEAACILIGNDGSVEVPGDMPLPGTSSVPGPLTDDTAYIIYTSGTSGRPKGVGITHANAVRLFSSTESIFHFNADDVWVLFHSFAFDFSVWETWGALLYGGRLVIFDVESRRDPAAVWKTLLHEGVTILNQTPSAFSYLVPHAVQADDSDALKLRLVIFGGESIRQKDINRWFDRFGDESPELINGYGVTETTVFATFHPLRKAEPERVGTIIGRPIPDLKLYVVDAAGALAPPGVPGELQIGGAGVGEGYVNREDLTAEQFVLDPFTTDPGCDRVYRTGDLVRFLVDGNIEHFARIDDQVQVRGYRVEPGEIELALTELDEIEDAVVIAVDDAIGSSRLVAYVVTRSGSADAADSWKSILARRLPAYMIPAFFVPLDRIPLTANGKANKSILAGMAPIRPKLSHEARAPRNDAERQMVEVWEDVLGIKPVGITDSFFDVGGHSLLAVKLATILKERLGLNLPLAALFESPTVEELVQRSNGNAADPKSNTLVTLQASGTRPPLFLLGGIGGTLFRYQPLSKALGADQPVYGLQFPGLDNECPPYDNVEEMAAHMVDQVRSVQPCGPYQLSGYCFGGVVAYEIARQLAGAGETISFLGLFDATAPPNLPRWIRRIRAHREVMRAQSPAEQWKYFLRRISSIGRRLLGIQKRPVSVEADSVSSGIESADAVMAASIRALESYIPVASGGSAILFQSVRDSGRMQRQARSWSGLLNGGLQTDVIPGMHHDIFRAENVNTLAGKLTPLLQAGPGGT